MTNCCCKHENASITAIACFTAIAGTVAWHLRNQSKEEQKKEKLMAAKKEAFTKFQKVKRSSSNKVMHLEDPPPVGTLLSDIKINEVYLWEVEHLRKKFDSEAPEGLVNVMQGTDYNSAPAETSAAPAFLKSFSSVGYSSEGEDDKGTSYNKLIATNECIIADIVRKPGMNGRSKAFIRAGPRKNLHFNPQTVNAAIVTCGGLCPGLNNVIREITNSLILMYGIEGKVYGIRGGYKGFYDPAYSPIVLTPELVEDIHHRGGTVLSSSRGGFDLDKILAFIEKMNIKQLYVIGGDGTHRGAFRIHEGCMEKVRRIFLMEK
jgi:6-phosphofructokinase 1